MPRRWGFVALAAAVAFALAGCVGIPTSGGVQVGPAIDPQNNPDIVVLPSDPRAGSSQQEILADFMQAVRGPQNDYAVARKFLTKDLAESWDPDARVDIRTAPAVTEAGAEPDTLEYTLSSRAYVDPDGRYFEQPPAVQTLTFGFVKQNGEWRISSAPNGIVLSQSSFNIVFTEQALYFYDPSHRYLVPDVRWFPSRATVPVRIVRALLAGPASWLANGVLTSAFPVATVLGSKSATVQGGVAVVDLSKEALAASALDRGLMRQQLAATLGVSNVEMTVNGVELAAPDSATALIDPQVEAALFVGTESAIGLDSGDGVTPIAGLSPKLQAIGAVAATLADDKQAAAALGADGIAYLAQIGQDQAIGLDSRGDLVRPSLDPFLFVWSAQHSSAGSIVAFGSDGTAHPLQSSLPADARIASIAVSRDGSRLLVYLDTDAGPSLYAAGIVRGQDRVPTALGPLIALPVVAGTPIDAAWVDDRTVATVSDDSGQSEVMLYELGGPSASLGELADAASIAGGNGSDGLRVFRASGEVYRPAGSGGWVDTGIKATFLGTKQ